LDVDTADDELAVARERLELDLAVLAGERGQRAPRAVAREHPRAVAARERLDAAQMIAVLVRDEHGGHVGRGSADRGEALLDVPVRQAAVDHQQRLARLDEQHIAAASARERRETQHRRPTFEVPDALGASGVARPALAASLGRVHRHGELGDVSALDVRDLADALLLDLVDAQNGVQREIGPLHAFELALDTLLGRIDDDRGAGAEHELLDFDETEERAVADASSVDLVNLALVQEQDLVNRLRRHPRGSGLSEAAELSTLSRSGTRVTSGKRARFREPS